MAHRFDFQQLAKSRLSDAKALLATGGNDAGAYYVAGYSIECALKACIAKRTKDGDFPPRETQDYYTHKLGKLLKTAQLERERDTEAAVNSRFRSYWSLADNWNEQVRYETTITRKQAEDFLEALDDPTNGVLRWLQLHW